MILEAFAAALSNGSPIDELMSRAFEEARASDAAGKRQLSQDIDRLMRKLPVEKVGPLAIFAGAIVEFGGAPGDFPAAVFDHLATLLEATDAESEDDQPEHYYLLERGAMACLSRSAALRKTLPQRARLMSLLRRYAEHYGFLGKMLKVLDDEALLVLDVPTGRGFRFRISGIADNFQLHTLLLGALAAADGGIAGNLPSPEQLAAASDGPPEEGEPVSSNWQLANWQALAARGRLEKGHERWIWNEGVPADIAPFEGTRVVLIAPSTIARSWNSGRIFSGMPGRLTPEGNLSTTEAQALTERLLTSPK